MANLIRYSSWAIIMLTSFSTLEAQTTPTEKEAFPFQSYQLIPDRLLEETQPKNKVFSDPLIGNYTVGRTGITTTNGHIYHIRIKEPDLTQVIPMPGANQKPLEHTQPFQSYAPSFHLLPKIKILPPRKDR